MEIGSASTNTISANLYNFVSSTLALVDVFYPYWYIETKTQVCFWIYYEILLTTTR